MTTDKQPYADSRGYVPDKATCLYCAEIWQKTATELTDPVLAAKAADNARMWLERAERAPEACWCIRM